MIFSIIEQALIALPLVLGAYITLSLLKLPDFSIESAYLMGAVAAAVTSHFALPFPIIMAALAGLFVATLVTSFNQFFHIPYLLAAIVTNGIFHGFSQYLLGSSVVSFQLALPFSEWTLILIIAIVAIGLFSLILRSQLGYSWAIYGNNPRFFASHNIAEKYVIFSGVALAHALAATSGFLFAHSNGFVDLTMNFGIMLLCLMALMVGKIFSPSYKPQIVVPIIGVVAYFTLQQLLLRQGLNLKYFNSFQAFCILLILFFRGRKMTLDHLGV
jgi:putative ABC transport system permease protein